jgi:hypothetical protein
MTALRDQLTDTQRAWLKDGAVRLSASPSGTFAGMYVAVTRTEKLSSVGRTPRQAIEALEDVAPRGPRDEWTGGAA